LLATLEDTRRRLASCTDAAHKAKLGQFMTPAPTARFMAGLFPSSDLAECRLLDAGAGIGSLSAAFLERWQAGEFGFRSGALAAWEIDATLRSELIGNLAPFQKCLDLSVTVSGTDFIEEAVNRIQFGDYPGFTHAILNPPYKKINSGSRHRLLLRQAGIETVNLYSGFLALALELMAPGGQLVAIVPRSFCNGPYYKPFREQLLSRGALRHLHLFGSRSKAFKDDDVLQENLILRVERGGTPGEVTVSTSTDDTFADLSSQRYPFEQIVLPGDPERFIHIPTDTESSLLDSSSLVHFTLEQIGAEVSTGPVVDFRLKEHLRELPEAGAVPLLYPGHLDGLRIGWPHVGAKKPNAIADNFETRRWLLPTGTYCVVRRFSAKEERRRIVAAVVMPSALDNAPWIGFENHLNLFHSNKRGLPEDLAWGLATYLNTTATDEHFRRFSGHTQVNATDLRRLKYPSREVLIALGEWARSQEDLSQDAIDERFRSLHP